MLESSLPTRQPQTMSCLTNTQLDLQVPMLSQKLILTSYCSRHLENQAESRELRPGAGAGTLTGEQDRALSPGCVTRPLVSCLHMLYLNRNLALTGPQCGLGTSVFKPSIRAIPLQGRGPPASRETVVRASKVPEPWLAA